MKRVKTVLTSVALIVVYSLKAKTGVAQTEELADFAVTGFRSALEQIVSADVRFVEINTAESTELDMDYLSTASYDDILGQLGLPRADNHPLGNAVVNRSVYREDEDKQYQEICLEMPAVDLSRTLEISVNASAAKIHSVRENDRVLGHLLIASRAKYYHNKRIHLDPSILFSHGTIGSYPESCFRFEYVDMIDRQGATAYQHDGRIIVESLFAFAGGLPEIIDSSGDESYAMQCRNELDEVSFLPLLIEYGSVSGSYKYRMEVESYFESGGGKYPERGSMKIFLNGRLSSLSYFIVDTSSALNISLGSDLLTVDVEPGTHVYDELLGTSYAWE